MNGRTGILVVLLAAGLTVWGIAAGAASQKETFIGNQVSESAEVSGDFTILSGLLVGLAFGTLLGVFSTLTPARKVAPILIGGASAWLLTFLLQSSWPNYTVIPEHGIASILQSNILVDAVGSPSVLLPVIATGTMLMIGMAWAIQRNSPGAEGQPSLSTMRRDHLGIAALAVPALVLTAAGLIHVMLELPDDMVGRGLMTLLNPLAAAGCLLLAVTLPVRARILARLERQPDQAWPSHEAWNALNRVDWAGIGAIAATAALSTFLAAEPADITSAGPTLIFTPRSHGQAVLFLAVVLVPLQWMHRRMGVLLPTARLDLEPATNRTTVQTAIFTALVSLAALLGIIFTFTSNRTLLPWAAAMIPAALAAGLFGSRSGSALPRLVAAWILWAMGNTIFASYSARQFPDLEFLVHPGILALWRMAAAALVGWVVYDALRKASPQESVRLVIPLALVTAIGVSLTMLLLLPLNVWAEATIPENKVAVGSLLMSQQSGVRVVMILMSAMSLTGASMAMARLLRPEWFKRSGKATDSSEPQATPV